MAITRFAPALKLRQLEYFLAVADALHFTRAADQVGATQSTLSHQIRELEERLGTRLFDRVGKTVRLTEAGQLFLSFALQATKQVEAGVAALAELEGLVKGELRLGVIQSFSHTLLPPVLRAFLSAHPGVQVSAIEMNARDIELGLIRGLFDLGIAFVPAFHDQTEVEPILSEELVLVVAEGHPLAARVSVPMICLDQIRMVLLDSSYSTRQIIDSNLARAGAKPDVVLTANSTSLMLSTVCESQLATIIPARGFPAKRHPDLCQIRLTEPTPERTSALLWPRTGYRTLAARTFAQMVRNHFRGLPPHDV